jgi:cobalt-precorrin 5A hydrolase
MIRVGIAAFTKRGKAQAKRIEGLTGNTWEVLHYEKNLKDWCALCFAQADAILFIGACGIAVRTIAPFLKSKTTDPAVLVMDEAGQFVISLLSGHIGGANELAITVAELTGATPVITTASDVNGKLAVDVFAKKNHLQIDSMTDAKKVEAAILRGERVGVYCSAAIEGEIPPELIYCNSAHLPEQLDHLIWISEYEPPREHLSKRLNDASGTILHLIPQTVTLGLGCRRGKTEEEIRVVVEKLLLESGLSPRAIRQAASIDLKKDEEGILGLCRTYGIPYVTYPACALEAVPGDFTVSDFVRKITGVDNVCERSALRAAGEHAKIIRKKYAENGVTAALAAQEWRVRFE